MFEFFPHIVIVIAIALVIIFAARFFPKTKKDESVNEIEKRMSSSNKKVSDIKPQKDPQPKKMPKTGGKKKRFSFGGRRRLPIDETGNVAVSVSATKKESFKKSKPSQNSKKDDLIEDLLKETSVTLDEEKHEERKAAYETKKQLHENILKVIDRVVIISKKGYGFSRKAVVSSITFIKVKNAERKRKKMTQGEIDQEQIVDLLADAAKNFGGKKYKDAEKNYIEIIKLDPKNIRAYKGLAELYELQGSFDDAIASIDFASKLDPLDRKLQQETSRLRKLKMEKAKSSDIKIEKEVEKSEKKD